MDDDAVACGTVNMFTTSSMGWPGGVAKLGSGAVALIALSRCP